MELGATIYSGEYVEVKSGLTAEDYIAFPYGTDVQEGVRAVVEGTEDPPHPEEDGSENIAVGSSQEEDNLEEDTSSALAPDGPVLYDAGAVADANGAAASTFYRDGDETCLKTFAFPCKAFGPTRCALS